MSKDKLDHVHRRESAKAPTIPHAEPIRGTRVGIKQETNPVKHFSSCSVPVSLPAPLTMILQVSEHTRQFVCAKIALVTAAVLCLFMFQKTKKLWARE